MIRLLLFFTMLGSSEAQSLGLVLGWKFSDAPGITTRGEKIVEWPKRLGPQPSEVQIVQWREEYNDEMARVKAIEALEEYALLKAVYMSVEEELLLYPELKIVANRRIDAARLKFLSLVAR